MTGRIKLAELKQREGLQGEVFRLFPSWHTGIIRGDDGNDVTFCEDWVKLQAGRKCITVPGRHVLVGVTGLFAREVRLPVGMPVVVQICRGQDEVSLHGTVSSSFADLGVSVEFEEKSGLAVQKLAALLGA